MPKPRSITPKEVIRIAEDAGFKVHRTGSRIIIINPHTEDEPMLSISGHIREDYDKGQAAAIRQWFRKHGVVIA
jgi:predicted RNA binding protein YcfA (HicA-like mRNA interferase family)